MCVRALVLSPMDAKSPAAEFKRRKQALVGSASKSVLVNLGSRTPRDSTPANSDGDRTPSAMLPAATSSVTALAEPPRSETARKILETLDNMARVRCH